MITHDSGNCSTCGSSVVTIRDGELREKEVNS